MPRIPGKTANVSEQQVRNMEKNPIRFYRFFFFASLLRRSVKLLFINVDAFSSCQQSYRAFTVWLSLSLLSACLFSPYHCAVFRSKMFFRFSLVYFTFYCYYIYRFCLCLYYFIKNLVVVCALFCRTILRTDVRCNVSPYRCPLTDECVCSHCRQLCFHDLEPTIFV